MIRLFIWLGVIGWALMTINFCRAWWRRRPRTMIRFLWILGGAGGFCYLLSRLVAIPYPARVTLDVAAAMAGIYGGTWLTLRFLNNPRVLD